MSLPTSNSLLSKPRRWWIAALIIIMLASLYYFIREWFLSEQDKSLQEAGWVVYDLNEVDHDITHVKIIKSSNDGRLWVGTNSGLHVFDGNNWESYLDTSHPGWSSVNALAIDADGRAWVSSYLGLTIIEDGRELSYEEFYVSESMATNSEGQPWSLEDISCNISLLTTDRLVSEIPKPSPFMGLSCVIAFDQEDNLWVSDSDDINKFNGQAWDHFTPIPNLLINAIAFDSCDIPWIGGMHRLQKSCCTLASMNTTTWHEHHIPFPQQENVEVSALVFDGKGTLWVAFSFFSDQYLPGLASLRNEAWSFFQTKDALDPLLSVSSEVEAVVIDNEGHLFFGVGPSLVKFDLFGSPPNTDPVPDRILTARRLANFLTWASLISGFFVICIAGWSTFINTQRGLDWTKQLQERALSSPDRELPSYIQSRAKVFWILLPGICLVAWIILTFMFWQGGSSNLSHLDGRPNIESFGGFIGETSLIALMIGAVVGILFYYGLRAVENRLTPTRYLLGRLALILGSLMFLASLALIFFVFAMIATG